ncbi:MAG TPA: hypothetical protein PKE69_15675 [Pyrinomonadaceae bacterium]|nr:hypothetical protein [Pyrinomonadaceae bacterium]
MKPALAAIAFSPDGKLLATVSHAEGIITLWNSETFQKLWSSDMLRKDASIYSSSYNDQRHSISFSSDGKYLAVGRSEDYSTHDIVMKSVPTPTPRSMPTPRLMPKSLDESTEDYENRKKEFEEKKKAEEEKRKTAEIENRLKEQRKFAVDVWNVKEGKKVKEFLGHKNDVPFVSFSKDNKFVVSGCRDKTIKIWDVETEKEVKSIDGISQNIEYLSLSKSNKFIVGTFSKQAKVWDFSTGKELFQIPINYDEIVEFSADEKLLLDISNTSIKRWDYKSKTMMPELRISYDRWMTETEKQAFVDEFYKELQNKAVIKIRDKYRKLLARTTNQENQDAIVEKFKIEMKPFFEKWQSKYGIEAVNVLADAAFRSLFPNQIFGIGNYSGGLLSEDQIKFIAAFDLNDSFLATIYESKISLWDWKSKKRITEIAL